MKYSWSDIFRSVLRQWHVLILAILVGVCCGFLSIKYTKATYVASAEIFISQDLPEGKLGNAEYSPNLYSEKMNDLMGNAVTALNNPAFMNAQKIKFVAEKELKNVEVAIKQTSKNIISVTVEYDDEVVVKKLCDEILRESPTQINRVVQDNIDPETGDFKAGTLEQDKILIRSTGAIFAEKASEGNKEISSLILYPILVFIATLAVVVCVKLCSNKIANEKEFTARYKLANIMEYGSFKDGINNTFALDLSRGDSNRFALFCNKDKQIEIENFVKSLGDINKNVLLVRFDTDGSGEIQKVGKNCDCVVYNYSETIKQTMLLNDLLNDKKYDNAFVLIVIDQFKNAGWWLSYVKLSDIVYANIELSKDSYKDFDKILKNIHTIQRDVDGVFLTK